MSVRYVEKGTRQFRNTLNLSCRYCGEINDKMAREPNGTVACLPCARADGADR